MLIESKRSAALFSLRTLFWALLSSKAFFSASSFWILSELSSDVRTSPDTPCTLFFLVAPVGLATAVIWSILALTTSSRTLIRIFSDALFDRFCLPATTLARRPDALTIILSLTASELKGCSPHALKPATRFSPFKEAQRSFNKAGKTSLLSLSWVML